MRKKLAFIFLLIIILVLGFVFSPLIIKKALINYLDSKLTAECDIASLSLSLDKIKVNKIDLKDDYFTLSLDSLQIDYGFKDFFRPQLKLFRLSGANLKITDLNKFKVAVLSLVPVSEDKKGKEEIEQIFNLLLDDITITIDESPKLFLDLDFAFKGAISASELIDLEALRIDKFDFRNNAISCAFRVEHIKGKEYTLYIDSVKRQEEEIRQLSLPLEISKDSVSIKEAPFLFLGPANKIEGKFEVYDLNHFCLGVFLKTATFSNVINFFGQEKNIIFKGPFDGRFDLCFKDGDLSSFNGNLKAVGQGVINLRKEVSFDFLKKYLDERSHNELVDSFNNYTYNGGKISLKKQAETISVHFDFDSQSRGRRNIEINYHLPR